VTSAEWEAIRLSLLVAAAAVAATLPFGVAFGWLLARKRFPGKVLLETLFNLPLVLPPVVTGYLLLVTFGAQGWLGRTVGLRIVFTWKAAALAAGVVSFPLMVRAIRVAFAAVDPRLEGAARTLGAPPLGAFFRVSLPLARHGVIAGAVLAFARAMGEFGATIMIAGNIAGETRTIPLYLFDRLEAPGGAAEVGRLIWVSIAIAGAALLAAEWLDRRERRLLGSPS
jgi:molybdate transport system permease protein